MAQFSGYVDLSQIQGRYTDVSEPGGDGGGGMGRIQPNTGRPSDKAPSSIAPARRHPAAEAVRDPRRGLLLTREQLSGPPAPAFLMRGPYVYARQNLL